MKNIYLGFLGVWLMSPPKQQSAKTSSPEVSPSLLPKTEASSQSSSEQGQSSSDDTEDQFYIFLDIIKMQRERIDKLEKQVRDMSDQHIEQLLETGRKLEQQSEIAGRRADAAIEAMIRQGRK